MLVPEEQLTHLTNVSGEPEINIKRADMVYFQVPVEEVFSRLVQSLFVVSSHNKFSNDISKYLKMSSKNFALLS